MKTAYGKAVAEVFDRQALEQIRDEAFKAAKTMRLEAQRLFKEHHAMAVILEHLNDQTQFECLGSAIDDLLKQ